MTRGITISLSLFLLCTHVATAQQQRDPIGRVRAQISFTRDVSATPVDGRVFLLISKNDKKEPRFEISEDETKSQQIFGIDVDGLVPGKSVLMDGTVLGYPVKSLDAIPVGDYYAQAVFHRYTVFHRLDGHVTKLPSDEGEVQRWWSKPGNFYSDVQRIHVDPSGVSVSISMTHVIPNIESAKDTKYVKHVVLQSKLLTQFWGEPMYLGAIVLLPEGWDIRGVDCRFAPVTARAHG